MRDGREGERWRERMQLIASSTRQVLGEMNIEKDIAESKLLVGSWSPS